MNIHQENQFGKFNNLPQELRDRKQWCAAAHNKAPLQYNQHYANVNDPETWMDFYSACHYAAEWGSYPGYVLSEHDEFTCIDLDVKPDTPQATLDFYQRIIDTFDSYTERSRSGLGFHIWVKGKVPQGFRRDGVEVYSSQRFIICTGDVYLDRPIESRQEILDILIAEMGTEKKLLSGLEELPEEETDDVILNKMQQAKNHEKVDALWDGNWQDMGYPSQSEADMALMAMFAFYSPSNEQCRRLFRSSGLGQREKATKNNRYLDRTLLTIRSRQAQEKDEANAIAEAVIANGWFLPIPLVRKKRGLPYPIHALPQKMRSAVEEVQRYTQAPLSMVASSALSSISLAVQGLVDVQRANKLESPSGCFILTIGETGERKTTCDRLFMKAIRDYEVAVREKCGATVQKLQEELCNILSNELDDGCVQFFKTPRLIYADITPESLALELATGWPSGGIISSEAGMIFGSHGMNKDSITRFLSLLNQLWDGASFSVDRKTSESIMIIRACFSMALLCQLVVIKMFLNQSGILARGIGFLARFLVAWPESTQGSRQFIEFPDDWPALDDFNCRITEILNISLPFDNGILRPKVMTFSPAAKEEWIRLHDKIEAGLGEDGEYSEIRDVANRVAENAARLAALFHVFEYGTDGEIQLETMEQAGVLVEWHLTEAKRLFEVVMPSEKQSQALRLERWLIERCKKANANYVSLKDLQQYGPFGMRRNDEYAPVLLELESCHRIRRTKIGRKNIVEVNPELLA